MITACICFRNEGEEIENTVKSIRETAPGVCVMLVDDCSDDGINYSKVAEKYGCRYYRMSKRVGSVGVKDWAARNVETEKFVLMDGHMRLYANNWDERIEDLLSADPNRIISSRTIYLTKNADGTINEEDKSLHSYCASVDFGCGQDYDAKWTDSLVEEGEGESGAVACVLGAFYATTKSWWKKIDGLAGLNIYGLEEAFMSIKTWLMGGRCEVLKDFGVGHVYRSENINGVLPNEIDANRLFLGYVFDNYNDVLVGLSERIRGRSFDNICMRFACNIVEADRVRTYIRANRIYDLDWYKENINDKTRLK